MGRVWRKANRRDMDSLQVEICDICGRLVGAKDRIQANVQGLYGRWICGDHGTLGTMPSTIDLGWPGNAPAPVRDIEPHSGDNWAVEEWD